VKTVTKSDCRALANAVLWAEYLARHIPRSEEVISIVISSIGSTMVEQRGFSREEWRKMVTPLGFSRRDG
jgi:hypothetical protein